VRTDGGSEQDTVYHPPELEHTEDENEIRHNSAPDRFVLCSGGMDSTAMAHYLIEEVWGEDDWGAWNKRPTVVFLDTTIGLSSQRVYVQLLGREFGWQVVCRQTHQDFEGHTEDEGFYANQQHDKIFNVVKGRQIGKMATEAGNPHIYFGSRVEEKGDHVERKTWRDDIGAYTHNPIFDWSDADVVEYLRDRGVPFNPNWECAHFTDCGCGATASREELLELEAEGYEVFAQKLRDLEERVETGDRRETWAWGSFSSQDRRVLDAQNDDEQTHLGDLVCGPNCSGCAKALGAEYPVADGGETDAE
jgi:3'-phosphoadenosine 5'-phosphosulfate sulfotransferase (PAPS reductase)/FAD synthetase